MKNITYLNRNFRFVFTPNYEAISITQGVLRFLDLKSLGF